ncbi:MAG: alkane 1-monooxygenase [Betaproteobacteria bacterium]|nr:alkane 1-monooxygenase [Betaproteobacteria bacterium]
MFWLYALLPVLFTITPSLGLLWGQPGLTGLLGFLVLPLLEWVWGRRATVQPQWGLQAPRAIMTLVLLQPVLLLAWVSSASPGMPLWHVAILGLACGSVGGAVGIVLAHELGHRRSPLDRGLARLLLCLVGWGHYLIEHNRGHHRHAALWHDPATARREESLWSFLPRYWVGVWRAAVALGREQRGRLNEAWALAALTAALWGAAWALAGTAGLVFCLAQAAVAQLLVASVDYVEHWGLQRRVGSDGRPERLTAQHVWDCSNAVSDLMLFNLPRHAHHHTEPWHGADDLRHTQAAPQMPTGYAGMVLLSLVPPLFRRVMEPRLATTLRAPSLANESA